MADGDASRPVYKFAQFYCDLVDHHRHLLPQYLSNNAVLDWFGHAVIGRESITSFYNDELPYTAHSVNVVQPTGPIQHKIKNLAELTGENDESPAANEESSSDEGGRPVTPDNKIPRPWDQGLEGMSDLSLRETNSHGYQHHSICNAPIARKKKRFYFDHGKLDKTDGELVPMPEGPAKFLEAFGTMEFIRQNPSPSSAKTFKRFAEQKSWKERNCKIKIGYTSVDGNVQISIIIYHDNMRCRKKLLFAVEKDSG